MHNFHGELSANGVEVARNLRPLFVLSHRLISFLDDVDTGDVYWMRVPSVDVLHDEFVIYILEDPVAHEVFANVANDILERGHY